MIHTACAINGMTTSPHHLASQAGLDVLKAGGDAIEAGVAMAACLAVVYPHMTGIGGDGFWVIRQPDGAVLGIDACGAAGRKVDLELYRSYGLETIPWRGPWAANTVAGTISGWQKALSLSRGKVSLGDLLAPAVFYAENGVVVTKGGAKIAHHKDGELSANDGYCDVFKPENKPLREGEVLRQPALALTLKRLINAGLDEFYTGRLATDIAADLQVAGSPLTLEDLSAHNAQYVTPLTSRISGAQLYNMTPPTQGLTSLLILSLFDRIQVQTPDDFEHVHALVEATKAAFRKVREIEIGDPQFMMADAQALLDNPSEIAAMVSSMDLSKASPWPDPTEPGDTVWFGAIDGEGRAVSIIQSTYFEFGSGVVLPQTGITWQNRGASFQLSDDGWNALKPGRKPFHTLNPAMAVFDDGRVMAYGTMGGEGQPQTQAALFSRYAHFGQSLQQAITAPRWLLGRTWGEETTSLKLESRFSEDVFKALRSAGHDVEVLEEFTSTMGHAGALVLRPDGVIEGASDPRSDGGVSAW